MSYFEIWCALSLLTKATWVANRLLVSQVNRLISSHEQHGKHIIGMYFWRLQLQAANPLVDLSVIHLLKDFLDLLSGQLSLADLILSISYNYRENSAKSCVGAPFNGSRPHLREILDPPLPIVLSLWKGEHDFIMPILKKLFYDRKNAISKIKELLPRNDTKYRN